MKNNVISHKDISRKRDRLIFQLKEILNFKTYLKIYWDIEGLSNECKQVLEKKPSATLILL